MAASRIQKASPQTARSVEAAFTPDSAATLRALRAIGAQLERIADTLAATPAEAASAPAESEPAAQPVVTLNTKEEALFQSLREWRAVEARKLGMPPYIVATDKVLRAVAQTRPGSVEQLSGVPGLGPAKLAKYGPGLVEVVATA